MNPKVKIIELETVGVNNKRRIFSISKRDEEKGISKEISLIFPLCIRIKPEIFQPYYIQKDERADEG